MITQVVKEHDLSAYLNNMWANDNMTPQQNTAPTVLNDKGDVEISVYAKTLADETYTSSQSRPWLVDSSLKLHTNDLVVKMEKNGYSLFYPALDKVVAETDEMAKKNPDTHAGVILVFFKGLLPTTTSTIEAATSPTVVTGSTTKSETTPPATKATAVA